MARLAAIFAALLFVNHLALASSYSPSPAPGPEEVGADSVLSQNSPSPTVVESPPPADLPLAPSPSPPLTPSPSDPVPEETSPAPSQAEPVTQINHSDLDAVGEEKAAATDGMSSGKKAGVAVGAIFAAAAVGVAGLVYKKRQDNIRRSRYTSATSTDLL